MQTNVQSKSILNNLQYLPWALVSILYAPVFYALYRNGWAITDYTHAYFILPVSLFIIWLKRAEIREEISKASSSSFFGISLLLFGLLSFVFGWRWDYRLIQTISLIPVLFGLSFLLYDKSLARLLLFPILYLLLLVPIPIGILDSITLPMRYGASVVSAAILKAMHYDIVREGLLLNLGGHEIFMGGSLQRVPIPDHHDLIRTHLYLFYKRKLCKKYDHAFLYYSFGPYRKFSPDHCLVPDHLLFRRRSRPRILSLFQRRSDIFYNYFRNDGAGETITSKSLTLWILAFI